MASSSSNSSIRQPPSVHQPILCNHGIPAKVATSHTLLNPERRFYCCSRRKWDDCLFWEWMDEELPGCYKLSFQSLKIVKERAEEQLNHSRLMESLNNEKLMLSMDKCNSLNKSLEDARLRIEVLEVTNEELESIIHSQQSVINSQQFMIKTMKWAFGLIALVFAVCVKVYGLV